MCSDTRSSSKRGTRISKGRRDKDRIPLRDLRAVNRLVGDVQTLNKCARRFATCRYKENAVIREDPFLEEKTNRLPAEWLPSRSPWSPRFPAINLSERTLTLRIIIEAKQRTCIRSRSLNHPRIGSNDRLAANRPASPRHKGLMTDRHG